MHDAWCMMHDALWCTMTLDDAQWHLMMHDDAWWCMMVMIRHHIACKTPLKIRKTKPLFVPFGPGMETYILILFMMMMMMTKMIQRQQTQLTRNHHNCTHTTVHNENKNTSNCKLCFHTFTPPTANMPSTSLQLLSLNIPYTCKTLILCMHYQSCHQK